MRRSTKVGSTTNSTERSKTGVDYYHVILTFLISFLAWPLTYFLNNGFSLINEAIRPFWMMAFGFSTLALIVFITVKASRINDWLYYGMTLFAFSCMIDLIISLEFNEVISNFMSEYLEFGEPYLLCPWGSAIALFDGIGFYIMYLLIAFLLANGKSWRSTGIYWGAGILNSMIVLLIGIATGKHSPSFCTFLNVPYVFLPIIVLIRAFNQEVRGSWNEKLNPSSFLKAFDFLLALGFIGSICLTVAKGVAALGGRSTWVLYVVKHEPALFLDDPAPYSIIQMLVYLFYLVPIQTISLMYTLKSAKPQFLWEMTLIHAGIMLQAQFSYICLALDPQTFKIFQSDWTDLTFWFVNLLILVVPHLYLYRLSYHRRSSASKNCLVKNK